MILRRRIAVNIFCGNVSFGLSVKMWYTVTANDVMRDFLEAHERELMNMVGFEWNEKLFREAVFEDGLEQGLEQGRISAVLNMLKEKLPLEMIARISEMSVEKIREIGRMHSLL